jgi:MYXO-CTERM domain-containing protein
VPGSYTASLSVTDSAEESSANVAEIDIEAIANNLPPIADAGDDLTGDIGETLVLDGSGSVDPENQALTYTWSQLSGPTVNLQPGANSTQRTFVAPNTTAPLTFRLTVSDGVSSDTDDVFVTVRPGVTPTPPKGIGNNQAGGMGPAGLLLLGLLGLARRRRGA